jgi:hypothetical protein
MKEEIAADARSVPSTHCEMERKAGDKNGGFCDFAVDRDTRVGMGLSIAYLVPGTFSCPIASRSSDRLSR